VTTDCNNLDAYLADDLPHEAAARFARHAESCDACHEAIDQQRWIDSLLQSNEAATLEPTPQSLHETRPLQPAQRRRATLFAACGFASLAAAILVALGWVLILNPHSDESTSPGSTQFTSSDTQHDAAVNHAVSTSRPPATFVTNENAIAVPLESNDDVTVVQLYPTNESKLQTLQQQILESYSQDSNGG
jgi:anti-sigma factor RsiW